MGALRDESVVSGYGMTRGKESLFWNMNSRGGLKRAEGSEMDSTMINAPFDHTNNRKANPFSPSPSLST